MSGVFPHQGAGIRTAASRWARQAHDPDEGFGDPAQSGFAFLVLIGRRRARAVAGRLEYVVTLPTAEPHRPGVIRRAQALAATGTGYMAHDLSLTWASKEILTQPAWPVHPRGFLFRLVLGALAFLDE